MRYVVGLQPSWFKRLYKLSINAIADFIILNTTFYPQSIRHIIKISRNWQDASSTEKDIFVKDIFVKDIFVEWASCPFQNLIIKTFPRYIFDSFKLDKSELARVISKNLSEIFYQRAHKLFEIGKLVVLTLSILSRNCNIILQI
ncbi:MAG: hypothetical protein EAZ19_20155 [Oscillatoriales cyanobacterium]|nr:MAG: hypothetical protein EAZ88_18480 [Oscillatoriales cyanobacterium]TAF69064.1 MAG: hypothetical protein EAZ59_09695 [Oscillatoriales cyanobacterium]TAG64865.1 MAG: hypothetical protein EAZ25_18395 [Oscillatoriales cyanobacterium]TAG91569.1 MAG: hypothetical protein EAZ19_20155 [Oscillatoriales cyanobacterium]TAH17902.1 MAG: hypothetical protein EAZ10_17520 [Oscillatoriales cyanobacterium]